jgi:hypothetical protein
VTDTLRRLTLSVVLAAQATDTSCQPQTTLKACQVDTRGIRVEQGKVVADCWR